MSHVRLSLSRKAILFFLIFSLTFSATIVKVPGTASAAIGTDGWTIITRSTDTKVVFVSSSTGDDLNDGLTARTPVKTITKGASLVRDGFPDQLLLKTGDVWTDESLGRFKSGRSASEPLVISYYGNDTAGRPKVRISTNFIDHNGQARNYLTIMGIEFVNYKMDPTDPAYVVGKNVSAGFRFVGGGDSILIEDCKLQYSQITVQSYSTFKYTNFALRRSMVLDDWSPNTTTSNTYRPQGIFAYDIDGLLIEENLFDHNGWNENVSGAGANQYNHNMYISEVNVGNHVTVRGNIVARASSHGIHGRPGGLYENNLIVNNSIGLQMGYATTALQAGTFATARNNVITEGKRMIPNVSVSWPQTLAVWGLEMENLGQGTVTADGNIVAHRIDNGSVSGITYNSAVTYTNNVQYDWYSGTFTGSLKDVPFDPSWLDSTRSVGSYNATLGGTATLAAFLTDARSRGLHQWPTAYTANAVNNYIRAGFNH